MGIALAMDRTDVEETAIIACAFPSTLLSFAFMSKRLLFILNFVHCNTDVLNKLTPHILWPVHSTFIYKM